MKIRSTILWVALLVILGMVNYALFQKEELRTTGELLYMELAPVDPRSLIQGDYMRLNYAVLQALTDSELPRRGQLLVEFDERRIATKAKLYDAESLGENDQLGENQAIINFQSNGWQVRIGAENYFFQEGKGELFEEAEYAELRLGSSGGLILVGLLDEGLNPIGDE